ncbi:MAG: hypothetical protein DLM68_00845 [Hyphomicrobiales bacterium]|nr:MAG: hypothetical protein DLM68_00845 [Hyphomicrobiales bacterium]
MTVRHIPQAGDFTVTVGAMRVRVDMEGMFGIGSTFCLPSFYARRDQAGGVLIGGQIYTSACQ